jgi:hypothetical protein
MLPHPLKCLCACHIVDNSLASGTCASGIAAGAHAQTSAAHLTVDAASLCVRSSKCKLGALSSDDIASYSTTESVRAI